MGIEERREAEREALKKKIFEAASEIILNEGYHKLSIRKIAKKIEYSPTSIYNYFNDKAEIVACVINENYNRIFSLINKLEIEKMQPDIALREGLTAFLWIMIENPRQFRAFMLSGIDIAESRSGTLNDVKIKDGDAMELLKATIEAGKTNGIFREISGEIGATLLMSAAFGLVSHIVTNNIIQKDILEQLIGNYVDILVNGMMKKSVEV